MCPEPFRGRCRSHWKYQSAQGDNYPRLCAEAELPTIYISLETVGLSKAIIGRKAILPLEVLQGSTGVMQKTFADSNLRSRSMLRKRRRPRRSRNAAPPSQLWKVNSAIMILMPINIMIAGILAKVTVDGVGVGNAIMFNSECERLAVKTEVVKRQRQLFYLKLSAAFIFLIPKGVFPPERSGCQVQRRSRWCRKGGRCPSQSRQCVHVYLGIREFGC